MFVPPSVPLSVLTGQTETGHFLISAINFQGDFFCKLKELCGFFGAEKGEEGLRSAEWHSIQHCSAIYNLVNSRYF